MRPGNSREEEGLALLFLSITVTWSLHNLGNSLGRQIGIISHEAIRRDQVVVCVSRMRARAVEHAAEKQVTVQLGDAVELILSRTAHVIQFLGERAIGIK